MTQIFEPGYLQSVFVPELPERRLGVADTARTSPSMKDFKLLVMMVMAIMRIIMMTRSSWLNCALRDDEAVYWVNIGHYEAVAVGNR